MSEAFARHYKLLDRIAVGGTAEVFRALYVTAEGQERPVVIKRILPQFARDERFRRLFHEEACVAVTMSHPSIVRVLDHGELGPTCYIALELVEGKDLGSLLTAAACSGQGPSPRLAAYVAAQVAEALEFIHSQTSSEGTPLHIIHRDVSPQNILVSYGGDVKLTDFGIAKSAIRREQTVDGTLRGKLDYMSPEQARLGPVDHRADIFALGCVLYEMLQGTPPFRGQNELDTLERVRTGRIAVPLAGLAAPRQLQSVLSKALAPAPEARYQRAGDMAAELRAYLAEAGAPSPENLGRWMRELEAVASGTQSLVDDAVRRLLGGDDAPSDGSDPGVGTTVFSPSSAASAVQGSLALQPATQAKPAPAGRRVQIAILALLLVALSGWLLWALTPAHRGTGRPAIAQDAGSAGRLDTVGRVVRRDAGSARHDGKAAALAKLQLRSQPSGATVLVEGKLRGHTPLTLAPPQAPFQLELQKEGYRTWRRRLDPASIEGPLQVTLVPIAPVSKQQSAITINTLPWSRVRLDGKLVGNTPVVGLVVRAGNHRLELLAPDGTLRKVVSVNLAAGANRSFTFDFTR